MDKKKPLSMEKLHLLRQWQQTTFSPFSNLGVKFLGLNSYFKYGFVFCFCKRGGIIFWSVEFVKGKLRNQISNNSSFD